MTDTESCSTPEDWTPGETNQQAGYTVGNPGSAGRKIRATRISEPAGWPDTAVDSVSYGHFEVRAASVRGLLHRARHTPRQDAFSLGLKGNDVVVTVCDGVGSLALSHNAAQHVVERLPHVVIEEKVLTVDAWQRIFAKLNTELVNLQHDGRRGEKPDNGNSMATTVLTAVLSIDAEGNVSAELAWVGDSEPYLLRDGQWRRLAAEHPAARAPIEDEDEPVQRQGVHALPSANPTIVTMSYKLRPRDLLVLMSDGVADPLGFGEGLVGGALIEWWSNPPEALDFAAQVGFRRKGFTDDRTAVGIWMGES